MSQRKADDYVEVELELDELDLTSAESKQTQCPVEKEIKQCDECGSEFYVGASKMKGLCPECANVLYGYPKCDHIIENGRCNICYWEGSKSEYIKNL